MEDERERDTKASRGEADRVRGVVCDDEIEQTPAEAPSVSARQDRVCERLRNGQPAYHPPNLDAELLLDGIQPRTSRGEDDDVMTASRERARSVGGNAGRAPDDVRRPLIGGDEDPHS